MDFNAIINLGIVGLGLLVGALLRAKVRILQRFLIPSAIIGGFFLLVFYNFVAPRINLEATFLGDLVYHLLNISFIAMALRNPSDDKPRDAAQGVRSLRMSLQSSGSTVCSASLVL